MGVFDFFREWSSSWDEIKFHYDEYIDAGDYVLAQLRQTSAVAPVGSSSRSAT